MASNLKQGRTVLVIDAEKAARRLLHAILTAEGYRVLEAENAENGLRKAVEGNPDLIVLEIALPRNEGLELLQGLREWNRTPVMVLSECTDDPSKVAALDAGASDYLTKPFSAAELLARLRVLLRPLPNVPDGPLLVEGELVVNLATHTITIAGQPVRLTPKEEVLFCVLARYTGKVVTCDHLSRSVWGLNSDDKMHDLRVLVWQLRKKLGAYGGEVLLKTEGSTGYKLALSANKELAAAADGLDNNLMG
jgi:two-component system KDP operon response regulator KdpE